MDSYNVLYRGMGHSVLQLEDTMVTKQYLVVNEKTKDFYNIEIPKNLVKEEFINDEIYYSIQKNGATYLNENINNVIPNVVVKRIVEAHLDNIEGQIDTDNSSEVIERIIDIFNQSGFVVRHILHYDNETEFLHYDVFLILNGKVENIDVVVDMESNIKVENNLIGNINNDDNKTSKKLGQILRKMDNQNSMMRMFEDEELNEAIKESLKQNHHFTIKNNLIEIRDRKKQTIKGLVNRKTGEVSISDELLSYGYDNIKQVTEQIEVDQILSGK